MKAKLVKESVDDFSQNLQYYEGVKFIAENRDIILQQYLIKMKQIFKDYLPYKKRQSNLDACSTIWWFKIVEPGWNPKFLNDLNFNELLKYDDENFLVILNDEIVHEALTQLGLPEDIMY